MPRPAATMVTVAAAESPSRVTVRTASPVAVTPAVSVLTVRGAGHDMIPLSASAQAKLTVTVSFGVVCHPSAFGGGRTVAVMVGSETSTNVYVAVLSSLGVHPGTNAAALS